MSDFNELIKSFPKTRDYVRDFYVYGFKTREEFTAKSARTYDNERRRLESWLAPFIRRDYVSSGSTISLAIDSNMLDTNPLFQVWKTKSFTDNDIVLHFLLLDVLATGEKKTAEEITDCILDEYSLIFDAQMIRRKCNDYAAEGILQKEKSGKKIVYYTDSTLNTFFEENTEILDALCYYSLTECFGEVGDTLLDIFEKKNKAFRVKHGFFVHTLEDEILADLCGAMKEKRRVEIEIKSTKGERISIESGVPLQIFVSTRSGRRFLCIYLEKSRRFQCYRLDSVKGVKLKEEVKEYGDLLEMLNRNKQYLWGVSFQDNNRERLQKLTMTVKINEPYEQYIVHRLNKEGRGGIVTSLGDGCYRYEKICFDCNEMMPWVKTFIGRITEFDCTSEFCRRKFYADLEKMYALYGLEE